MRVKGGIPWKEEEVKKLRNVFYAEKVWLNFAIWQVGVSKPVVMYFLRGFWSVVMGKTYIIAVGSKFMWKIVDVPEGYPPRVASETEIYDLRYIFDLVYGKDAIKNSAVVDKSAWPVPSPFDAPGMKV